MRATPLQSAIILVLVILLVAHATRLGFSLIGGTPTGEHFVSQRTAIMTGELDQFFKSGGTTYSQAKAKVKHLEPVAFADARKLYEANALTAEAMQSKMD